MSDKNPVPEVVEKVVEGEIVSPAGETVDLTGLINSHLAQIDRLKVDIAQLKEMLDAIFANDPTYQNHDAAAREAAKIRSQTKKQLLRLPQAADLAQRIQDKKSHLKELSSSLSDYLQDYSRSTGATTFESADGVLRQIVYVARLIKPAG